jgi:hypothetical protein
MMRARALSGVAALAICFVFGISLCAAQQQSAPAREPAAAEAQQPPITPHLADDHGHFEITLNGQKVGSEDFSISKSGSSWVAKGSTDLHSANGSGKVTGELHLSANGSPLKYVWTSDTGKKASSTTTFDGLTAKMSTTIAGAANPIKQDFLFKPPVVILDNNLYHQYGILARLYNWSAGGPQNFNVLIPQEHMPGSITVEMLSPENGLQQLRVHTADLDVLLFTDSSHRLMRISVPTAHAEILRK